MNIKKPFGLDISHWNRVTDFTKIVPAPYLVITKATEAADFTDEKFVEYLNGIHAAGYHSGVFHFMREWVSGWHQATHFINTIQNYVTDKDILAMDVDYLGAASGVQMVDFMKTVSARFPRNIKMIYSRKNILDNTPTSTDQSLYLKQFPVWTAGYPANPDLFLTVPDFYVPNQNKWGPVYMWQYSGDTVTIPGVGGAVDLNWVSESLQLALGNPVPVPPALDTVKETHPGIVLHTLNRFGAKVWVQVIDTQRVAVKVTGRADDFHQVGQTVAKYGAAGGINGGGWPYGQTYANEIWVSDGVALQTKALDDRPWIGIDVDNHVLFGRGQAPSNVFQAWGFDRYLIKDGVINALLRDSGKDARTFAGMNEYGKLVLCVAEGDDRYGIGLTFTEEAKVLQEFGVTTGGNCDGGSSTTMYNNGRLNKPSDGTEAYVINQVYFIPKEGSPPPPTGDKMQAKEKLGKTVSIRNAPNGGGALVGSIAPYSTISYFSIVPDSTKPLDPAYQWFNLGPGSYAAYIYPPNGERFTLLDSTTPPPPPAEESVAATLIIGTATYKGTLAKQ